MGGCVGLSESERDLESKADAAEDAEGEAEAGSSSAKSERMSWLWRADTAEN